MAIVLVVTTSIAMGTDTTSSTTVKEIASAKEVRSVWSRKPRTVAHRTTEIEIKNAMISKSTCVGSGHAAPHTQEQEALEY
jgi:hypothetical protein